MGLYHFTAKVISMGKGESAVHRAAYHARIQLYDNRNGKLTRDYAHKGDLAWQGIFAPKEAPDWTRDRDQLWNRAEAAERQANGQPARNVEFALPNELTREQQIHLVTDFCREQFARKGMIADANLHSDYDAAGKRRRGVPRDEPRNDHVHVLLTMRRLDGAHFARTKTDAREWNRKAQLESWREAWARIGAKALQKAGFEIEAKRFAVGHLTLPAQRQAALDRGDSAWADRLDREPDMKQGAAVSRMEARGKSTDRAKKRRDIQARNAERDELRREAEIIDLELERLKRRDAREESPPPSSTAHQARIEHERGRFEEWANTRRAELQNVRLEADGELGRKHTAELLVLEQDLHDQYGATRKTAKAELAAIAGRRGKKGLQRMAYRLSGRAAEDSAEGRRLKLTMGDIARRVAEQQQTMTARQKREREALAAEHARQAAALEQRIGRAHERRKREGWVKPAANDRTRREATTGREIGDRSTIGPGARNASVDALKDAGQEETAASTTDAVHDPGTRQDGRVFDPAAQPAAAPSEGRIKGAGKAAFNQAAPPASETEKDHGWKSGELAAYRRHKARDDSKRQERGANREDDRTG